MGKQNLSGHGSIKNKTVKPLFKGVLFRKFKYYAFKCHESPPNFLCMNTRGYVVSAVMRWYEVIPQHNNLALEIYSINYLAVCK